jgi:hypothetical protein
MKGMPSSWQRSANQYHQADGSISDEDAFGRNDEVFPVGRDGFEEALGIGECVAGEDRVALLVEDAEEHRLGV